MIPLAVSTWDKEEEKAIHEVMASGRYTMGAKTEAFERAYADYVGTKYCVAVNSGSSANLLMVAAFTLRNSFRQHFKPVVIVPAVGWSTSYSPFQQYGWQLVFCDIDADTLNYDLDMLHRLTGRHSPNAILAINLLGNPNDYARFPDVPIIEDNCEAMGAQYCGRMTGSFGVMASHSTFFSHHLCTMEGGLITTDDEHYYHMLLSIRSHGWTRHLPAKNRLDAKVDKFHFIYPGYNVRPTEMQCAIGLEQLKKLPGFIRQRRDNANRFPFRTQQEIGKSSWFGMTVYGKDRELVGEYESRPVVTGNFLRQPAIKYYDYVAYPVPNADYIHDNALMIGNSHERIDWRLLKAA